MMRIDKYLAEMGQGTRSEIKKLIRSGRVMVDGENGEKIGNLKSMRLHRK